MAAETDQMMAEMRVSSKADARVETMVEMKIYRTAAMTVGQMAFGLVGLMAEMRVSSTAAMTADMMAELLAAHLESH